MKSFKSVKKKININIKELLLNKVYYNTFYIN